MSVRGTSKETASHTGSETWNVPVSQDGSMVLSTLQGVTRVFLDKMPTNKCVLVYKLDITRGLEVLLSSRGSWPHARGLLLFSLRERRRLERVV